MCVNVCVYVSVIESSLKNAVFSDVRETYIKPSLSDFVVVLMNGFDVWVSLCSV